MHYKRILILFAIAGITIPSVYSCNKKQQPEQENGEKTKRESSFSVNGSVREMSISPENPQFPEHEGKAEFVSYCAMCHTLKYISMQPDFPAKTWDAEVTKMVAKYKAPIDSATCRKIVAYLVAVKTKS